MAKKISSDVMVLLDGYDLGTAGISTRVSLASVPLDPTVLGDAAERVIGGQRKDTFEYSGLFDDDAASVNAAAGALLGSAAKLATLALGTAIGNLAYTGTCFLLKAALPARIGELVKFEVNLVADQAMERGKLATTGKNTILASGTGTTGTGDNSAATVNGGNFYIHQLSQSVGTVQYGLQHGSDGTTWVEKVRVVGGTGRNWGGTAFTGTLNRYTRITGTGGTSGTASYAAIIVRS